MSTKNLLMLLLLISISAAHLSSGMQLHMKYPIIRRNLDEAALKEVEARIGYSFTDKALLTQALTSASILGARNYERHEYLGDALLEAVIAPLLVRHYPQAHPGMLTAARTAIVSQEPLAALCLHVGLHSYVQHINAEVSISVLCDIIEALIGAIYEDKGFEEAKHFVLRFFLPMLRRDSCPTSMASVLRSAAPVLQINIEYRWVDNQCELIPSPGNGQIGNPLPARPAQAGGVVAQPHAKSQNKKDPKRLARYCAEYAFIKQHLPAHYQSQLVCLPIDPTYEPLTKVPELELAWSAKVRENFRMRLHTLMQKLAGRGVVYECRAENESFECILRDEHFETVITMAPTKREAQEYAALKAYKDIQRSIILKKEIDPKTIPEGGADPISALNVFCQAQRLDLPVYTSYVKGKGDAVCFYSRTEAPWLIIEIKGPSCLTVQESKAAAAQRILSFMTHACTDGFDPAKLSQLVRIKEALNSNQNSLGALIQLCSLANLAEPVVTSQVCEGLLSEGLFFQATITIPNNTLGAKAIVGKKMASKKEAQEDAAKKALIYIVNKLLKHEVLENKPLGNH